MSVWLAALFAFQVYLDADRLKQAMPAIELLAERRLDDAFKPYVKCYVDYVESSPARDLIDDAATKSMFDLAFSSCEPERISAERSSRDKLGNEKDQEIQAYRRVSIWSALRTRYYARHLGKRFDAAFVRLFGGRRDEAGN